MKLNLTTTLCGASLFLLVLMTGCQTEELVSPEQKISNRSHDCSTVCIDPLNPVYEYHTGLREETFGNQNSKFRRFTYSVHNTLDGFVFEWNYTSNNNGARRLTINVNGDAVGGPVTFTTPTYNSNPSNFSGSYTFTLAEGWNACDVVSFTVRYEDGSGTLIGPAFPAEDYALVGECVEEGCESTLTAALSCNDGVQCGRTVTFTFIPAEDGEVKIQGGLTNNTTICSMSGDLEGVVRDSPNQANVTTWTGDVVACETYTITINWTRHPSPSGQVAPEATGGWSASLNGVEVAYVDPMSCGL